MKNENLFVFRDNASGEIVGSSIRGELFRTQIVQGVPNIVNPNPTPNPKPNPNPKLYKVYPN